MLSGPVACECFLMFLIIFVVSCGSKRHDGDVDMVAEFAACNTSFHFCGSDVTCVCVMVYEDGGLADSMLAVVVMATCEGIMLLFMILYKCLG